MRVLLKTAFPLTVCLVCLALWGGRAKAQWLDLTARSPVQRSPAPFNPGDLIYTDSHAALLRYDSSTGQSSLLMAGGPLLRPYAIAIAPDRNIYVTDTGWPGVLVINPISGTVRLLQGGPELGTPFGIAVSSKNQIYTANGQSVVGVDPVTGACRVVASGRFLRVPLALAAAPNGDLYVADALGSIVRVDPSSGSQRLVTSGGLFLTPAGITLGNPSTLYVSDASARCIVRVHSHTGAQSLVALGGHLVTPLGMDLVGKNILYVGDPDALELSGAIIRLDLRTGEQSLVTSGQGEYVNPRCVAVVPSR